jgi:hypothetical protein
MIEQQAADADVVGNILILVDQDDAGLAVEVGEVVLLEGSVDGANVATVVHVVGRNGRLDSLHADTGSEEECRQAAQDYSTQ